MKYVMLFTGTMDAQESWDNQTRDEMMAAYAKAGQWFDEHSRAGRIVGGEQLQSPTTATTVRFDKGKPIVTDGPFIEAKEVIGGFAIVDVKDLDEALAMAKAWPGGTVEIRPVVENPGR